MSTFKEGQYTHPIKDCPHKQGTIEHEQWWDGWLDIDYRNAYDTAFSNAGSDQSIVKVEVQV